MHTANCEPILIGSLPLKDHAEAVARIFSATPQIPLWPQLPKNPKEGMVRQFVSGFPGLTDIEHENRCYVNTSSETFQEEMAHFYEDAMAVEDAAEKLSDSRFSLGRDTAEGFFTFLNYLLKKHPVCKTVKGQVTGPVTTGVGIKDDKGNSILYDDNLRDILITLLALKARYQITEIQKIIPNIEPIIFIDEPALVSFGSSGFAGVTSELVIDAVERVIDDIKKSGGVPGVHICANGDWGPPLLSNATIISFDAYFYFDNFILYREQLASFLSRGGLLAWGIVPTGDPEVVEKIDLQSLYEKWCNQVQKLVSFGFPEKKILTQTFIAPSCGTGSLSESHAMKVLSLTRELSEHAKERLSAL